MLTLRAKSWQVFLLILVSYLLMGFTVTDRPLLTGGLYTAGLTLYLGWLAVLGNTLADLLPAEADYSRNWFLLDAFVSIAASGAVAVLTDSGSYHAQGLAALPGLYLMFALGHNFWFPAVALVAIEKGRKPEAGFYFGTLVLVLFWPLGVWFVQPRLNRLYQRVPTAKPQQYAE